MAKQIMIVFLVGCAVLILSRPNGVCAENPQKNKLPLISKIVSKEKKSVVFNKKAVEVFPRDLTAREASMDFLEILPKNELFYFESSNGQILKEEYRNSSIAKLLNEKSIVNFLKKNDLSLSNLFVDLPKEYSENGTVVINELYLSIIKEFVGLKGRVALVGYRLDDKNVSCFIVNIGGKRKAIFDSLQKIINKRIEDNPELILRASKHNDDYIDKIYSGTGTKRQEIAFGFIKNVFVLSNNFSFSEKLLASSKSMKDQDCLADEKACRYLDSNTDTNSQLRGYINLKNIKKLDNNSKDANYDISIVSDIASQLAIYYDLSVVNNAVVEHITIPTPSNQSTATLANRINLIIEKDSKLNSKTLYSTKLMPISTSLYLAFKVNPLALISLLSENTLFGTSTFSQQISNIRGNFFIDSLKELSDGGGEIFDGEVSFGLIGQSQNESSDWIMSFPLKDEMNLLGILQNINNKPLRINNVDVYTKSTDINGKSSAWAIFRASEPSFRNLGKSFLVCSSSPKVMARIIERIVGGQASLLLNEDFIKQIDLINDKRSMVCYYNMANAVSSNYPNNLRNNFSLSFPKSQIHAIPSLSVISKYLFGVSIYMSASDDYGIRFGCSSPIGVLPTVGIAKLLSAPVEIRNKEFNAIIKERKKISILNLALQEYATLYGKFPDSLTRLRDKEALSKLLPEGKNLNELLTNSAAVYRIGKDDAREESWRYVSGLRPSDVTSTIILYNKKPFHYKYRTEAKKIYEPFYMVLTIGGDIKLYSKNVFEKKIKPTINNY